MSHTLFLSRNTVKSCTQCKMEHHNILRFLLVRGLTTTFLVGGLGVENQLNGLREVQILLLSRMKQERVCQSTPTAPDRKWSRCSAWHLKQNLCLPHSRVLQVEQVYAKYCSLPSDLTRNSTVRASNCCKNYNNTAFRLGDTAMEYYVLFWYSPCIFVSL